MSDEQRAIYLESTHDSEPRPVVGDRVRYCDGDGCPALEGVVDSYDGSMGEYGVVLDGGGWLVATGEELEILPKEKGAESAGEDGGE